MEPIPVLPLESTSPPKDDGDLQATAAAFLRRVAVIIGLVYALSYAAQIPIVFYAWRDPAISGRTLFWTFLLEGAHMVAGTIGGAMIVAGGRRDATSKLVQVGAAVLLVNDALALAVFCATAIGSRAGPVSGAAMLNAGVNYSLRVAGHALPAAAVFALMRGAFARSLSAERQVHGTPA